MGPTLLPQLAAAVDPDLPVARLLSHGRVGLKATRLKQPSSEGGGAAAEVVPVSVPLMYSVLPLGIEAVGQGVPLTVGDAARPTTASRPNLLASWIVGRPVYGAVLLTSCRASLDEVRIID